jgi:hypothetical protein
VGNARGFYCHRKIDRAAAPGTLSRTGSARSAAKGRSGARNSSSAAMSRSPPER